MKITAVETLAAGFGSKNCVFVRLRTDAGVDGISETVMKRRSRTIETAIQELGRYLVGKDPSGIEDHWEKMYRDSFWVGGPMHATPLSAVEIALWDLQGKLLGVPIHRLLGGPTRRGVPVYCHCAAGASPAELATNAKACVSRGYHAIKTTLPLFYGAEPTVRIAGQKPAGSLGYSGTWGEVDRSRKETELLPAGAFGRIREFLAAAREAVGPGIDLMVDCHGRLSASNARLLCEKLADLDLLFVEEPVPPENLEALREVCASSPVPIASGERWATIYGARPFLAARAVAVAQPDIVNCGGFLQAKKIAAMAEAEYIPLAPHNPNGPLATAAGVQLAACIPNFLILETIGSEEDRAMQARVTDPPLRFEDGCLLVPEGPGLGLELDWEACAAMPYKPFEGWR